MIARPLGTVARSFWKEENGTITPFAIFMVLIFLAIGGLAVDFNKAVSERAQLQTATDSAAHAALYSREFNSTATATDDALAVVVEMLPPVAYNNALLQSDIEFGYIDETTGDFVVDNSSRSAVRATASLTEQRQNPSRNLLLSVIGQDTFDISAVSVFQTYYPGCLREGYVAKGIVDLQSGNSYRDGFCVHSNQQVEIQQGNFLELGVTVGMPNMANFQSASSAFAQNDGLEDAMREEWLNVRLLNQMDRRMLSLRDGSPLYAAEARVSGGNSVLWPLEPAPPGNSNKPRERFTGTDLGNKSVDPTSFDTPNRIYQLECAGSGTLTFDGGTYSNFVLVTSCPVTFSNGTALEGVIVATEGDVSAVQTRMGADDGCAPGGGAQVWTQGNFTSSSNFEGYGAQIIAQGDVSFPANSSGPEGLSVIAGGRIDATSNASMAFCDGGGMENVQEAALFRMIR